jgi:mono/diheme cytochrome c family protein
MYGKALGPWLLSVGLAGLVAGVAMSSARPAFASERQDPVVSPGGQASTVASVLDGVFTAEQAARGRQTFQRVCMSCHTVAEHSGRKFEIKWADSTLGDIFDVISTTMPEGNPGSLNPYDYASIIAFVLKESGYPEGERELPTNAAALMNIRIEPLLTR